MNSIKDVISFLCKEGLIIDKQPESELDFYIEYADRRRNHSYT